MKVIPLTPVYDRSRVVTDWKCPRARYWNYEYMGRGLVSPATSLPLYMGITIHDAMASIATLTLAGIIVDIDLIANAAFTQMYEGLIGNSSEDEVFFAKEQGSLVEGLVRGFFRVRWPQLLAQYPKILLVESELHYDHDGLRFMSKPDLIMANDEEVVYVEYKSTSSKKDEWVNSWTTAVQLHSTIRAVQRTHGIRVDTVVIQGLYKGYSSYGKQSSPLCYAYRRAGNPPFIREEFAYDYKAGFRKHPVWELEGGVKKWVEEMPIEILADQFPQTPPIYIKNDLVDAFFRQRAERETGIKQTMDFILSCDDEKQTRPYLDSAFPQKFDQCIPGWGSPCSYRNLCHGPERDPLDLGFIFREPHHEPEVEFIRQRLENLKNV